MRIGLFCLLALSPALELASAQGLPPDLPLPAGLTITGKIQRFEYDREEFSYQAAKGSEHVVVAGHRWTAFYKPDASASVAAWKAALEKAGWQVLSERHDAAIARHGDWWVKIGPDRLSLVQHVDAAGLELTPPAEKPEELKPNSDIPYVTPLPGVTRKEWKMEERFELADPNGSEPRMLGPAVRVFYQGSPQLSVVEVQARYQAALLKAGWKVLPQGGITGGHYTEHGRDVWAKITPLNGGAFTVEVADMGIAAGQSRLARELDDAGHVALYGIYFDTDKAVLRPDSQATLEGIHKLLTSHPALKLEIQGHTDNTGTRPHNQSLSEQRAASVKAWLTGKGIDGARLTSKGYADTKPVADNGTPQGRALNRRVELAKIGS